jgi:hypothetical protein
MKLSEFHHFYQIVTEVSEKFKNTTDNDRSVSNL